MPWYGMPRAGESGGVVMAELARRDGLAPNISEEPGGGNEGGREEECDHPSDSIDSASVSDHRLALTKFAWTVGSGGTEVASGVAGRATRRSSGASVDGGFEVTSGGSGALVFFFLSGSVGGAFVATCCGGGGSSALVFSLSGRIDGAFVFTSCGNGIEVSALSWRARAGGVVSLGGSCGVATTASSGCCCGSCSCCGGSC